MLFKFLTGKLTEVGWRFSIRTLAGVSRCGQRPGREAAPKATAQTHGALQPTLRSAQWFFTCKMRVFSNFPCLSTLIHYTNSC